MFGSQILFVYLFIYDLFFDTVSILDYIAWNRRIIGDDEIIWEDVAMA
jgi:hypothetical protein